MDQPADMEADVGTPIKTDARRPITTLQPPILLLVQSLPQFSRSPYYPRRRGDSPDHSELRQTR